MATPIEIIDTRDLQGLPVSQRVHDVRDTAPGLTRALKEANIMKILGGSAPGYLDEASYNPDVVPPSLSDVMSYLGVKGTKDKSAQERFIEDFPKKLQDWKDRTLKDPKWGKSGWETIKLLYQQAVKDKGIEETAKARKEAMEGSTAGEKAVSLLSSALYPRMKRAGEEGRDPTPAEIAGDFGAQVAYAVPVGKILGAGGLAKSLAANAIAPTAVAAYDYATDPDKSATQAGLEALVGTSTNLGLNRYLAPMVGRALGTAAGKISTRLEPGVRRIFEAPPTGKEKAAQTIKRAASVLKAPETASADVLAQAAEGTPIITEADKRAAQAIMDIAEQSRAPGTRDVMSKVLSTDKYPAEKVFDLAGRVASGSKNRLTVEGARKLGPGLTSKVLNADQKAFSEQFQLHPELLTLYKDAKQPLVTPGGVGDILRTEVFNQIGNVEPEVGEGVLTRFGVDVSGAKEKAEKGVKEKKGEAQIANILKGDEVTADDEKWLGIVRSNPDVLQYGYSKDPEGFKRWLLTRGADLLRNTAFYRPAWKAE